MSSKGRNYKLFKENKEIEPYLIIFSKSSYIPSSNSELQITNFKLKQGGEETYLTLSKSVLYVTKTI